MDLNWDKFNNDKSDTFARWFEVYQYLHRDGLRCTGIPFEVAQPWLPALWDLAASIAEEGGYTIDEIMEFYHAIYGY